MPLTFELARLLLRAGAHMRAHVTLIPRNARALQGSCQRKSQAPKPFCQIMPDRHFH